MTDAMRQPVKSKQFPMRINFFGLGVSKTIPNLSAILDRSFNGNCLVPEWSNIVPQYVPTPTPNFPLHRMHGYLIEPQS